MAWSESSYIKLKFSQSLPFRIYSIYYLFYLLYNILSTLKSATRRDYTVLMYALHLTCMVLFEGVLHTTSTSSAVSQSLLLLRGAVCSTLRKLSLYKHLGYFNCIFRLVVSVAPVWLLSKDFINIGLQQPYLVNLVAYLLCTWHVINLWDTFNLKHSVVEKPLFLAN